MVITLQQSHKICYKGTLVQLVPLLDRMFTYLIVHPIICTDYKSVVMKGARHYLSLAKIQFLVQNIDFLSLNYRSGYTRVQVRKTSNTFSVYYSFLGRCWKREKKFSDILIFSSLLFNTGTNCVFHF
jgi:hypothetical protein